MQGLVKEVKERFGIAKCTMIFDRGMVSADNLTLLEEETWTYISCMDRDETAALSFFGAAVPGPVTLSDYERVMHDNGFEPFDEEHRLFLRARPATPPHPDLRRRPFPGRAPPARTKTAAGPDLDRREEPEVGAGEEVPQQRDAAKRIKEMQRRKGVKRFLAVQIEPATCTAVGKKGQERTVQTFRLAYLLDQASLEQEQRLHGVTCFITPL